MSNLALLTTSMNTQGFSANVIDHVLEFVKNNQISDNLSRIQQPNNLFIPLRVGFLSFIPLRGGFLSVPPKSARVIICLPLINRYVGYSKVISTRDIVIRNTSKTAHLKLQKKYDEKIRILKNGISGMTVHHNRQIINGLLSVVTHGTTHDYIDLSNKINNIICLLEGAPKDNMFDAPSFM